MDMEIAEIIQWIRPIHCWSCKTDRQFATLRGRIRTRCQECRDELLHEERRDEIRKEEEKRQENIKEWIENENEIDKRIREYISKNDIASEYKKDLEAYVNENEYRLTPEEYRRKMGYKKYMDLLLYRIK